MGTGCVRRTAVRSVGSCTELLDAGRREVELDVACQRRVRLPRHVAGIPQPADLHLHRGRRILPTAVGLNGAGYLWGERLTRISVLDFRQHLGWADASLVATIILQARLGCDAAAELVRTLDSEAA